jgi:hypothetical protein
MNFLFILAVSSGCTFLLLPTETLGILRPTGENNGGRNNKDADFPNDRQGQLPVSPSLDLIPPSSLTQPASANFQSGPAGSPSELSSSSSKSAAVQGSQLSFEDGKVDLLPPVEIPPEFPLDNPPSEAPLQGVQQLSQSSTPQLAPPSKFLSPPVLETAASSLLPTTGRGSNSDGEGTFPVLVDPFSFASLQDQNSDKVVKTTGFSSSDNSNFNQVAPSSGQPKSNCMGTCECPAEFDFVCGSNRFLYQNECALECDKGCNPGLVKVTMAQCS